jgi:hypothetical protein
LFILLVGVGREVLIQVVLRNCVYNFVCHLITVISNYLQHD